MALKQTGGRAYDENFSKFQQKGLISPLHQGEISFTPIADEEQKKLDAEVKNAEKRKKIVEKKTAINDPKSKKLVEGYKRKKETGSSKQILAPAEVHDTKEKEDKLEHEYKQKQLGKKKGLDY